MNRTPIYTPKQVCAGSFLGGPVALVYFLRNNFKKLGNNAAAAQTLLWGFLFNIAILASIPFLPKNFPHYVIPLAYSLAAQGIANAKQMKKESIETSLQFCFHSDWRVFGLSVAFLTGTLLVWFSILFVLLQFHIINLN